MSVLPRLLIAIGLCNAFATPLHAMEQRCEVNTSSLSQLSNIRIACPALAAIIETFAMRDLGEVDAIEELSPDLLGLEAHSPITEDIASFARKALAARALGAKMNDFGERLYLTVAAHDGERAIAAMRQLIDLYAKDAPHCGHAVTTQG